MRSLRVLAAGLVLATVASMGAACSGGSSARTTASTLPGLSLDQATTLANALFDNFDRGGGQFEATLAAPGGRSLQLVGTVDWKNHLGRASVVANGLEAGIAAVAWDERTVLERRPALDQLLPQAGFASARWVARVPDTPNRDIDRVVSVVAGLASKQRDNPLLVRQTAGSGFLRDETVRGVPTQVLRFGERNMYWLAKDDGRIVSFSGTDANGQRPVRVEVLQHSVVTVEGPSAGQVVAVTQVQDLYDAARKLTG